MGVAEAGEGEDCVGEGAEGGGGGDGTGVGGAIVVLDFLQEDEVWSAEIVGDVHCDGAEVRGVGGEILHVVGPKGEVAFSIGGELGWGRRGGGDGFFDCEGGSGEDGVEAESICDDTSNVREGVAEADVHVVFGAVEGPTDDDGFGVGVGAVTVFPGGDGEPSAAVLGGDFPVAAADPGVAVVVWSADRGGALDGYQFALQGFPKVQAVELWLESEARGFYQAGVVGDGKDISVGIELGEELCWRRKLPVEQDWLWDDNGGVGFAEVLGACDFSEEQVGLVTPVLFDFSVDGDGFSGGDIAADGGSGGAGEDVDALRGANVLVGGGITEPESSGANGSHDTSDIGDGTVDEGGVEPWALNLGD